ncbi:MAG: carboxypeptidase-like regulatory domain-containing protein [Candidatus Riflebacteria bacterium]|nr:carboxypeptidase-like regulatory domain-containing protein [Candidatus Riflebacteria bacterium]
MIRERRNPKPFGILVALFLVLIVSLVGCEKGTLGLKGGGISGSVLDSRTLTGISGVSVTALSGKVDEDGRASKFVTSDSNGNYYFSDMRADEWTLTFDKVGYLAIDGTASNTVSAVVVNSETSYVPSVRMEQTYENQYVTVSGVLKDAINGTLISYGNAQFIFGQQTFSNRLPTELTTGFRIPASLSPISLTINVTGYQSMKYDFDSLRSDRDIGTVLMPPETYSVVGRWQDVPGWVFLENPAANIFAYSGNRVVATATSHLNEQQFTISGIPRGVSVSIEAEIKGYRMNGPVVVYPSGDFQGTIYQTFSLKNNFSPIMRDVRVVIYSNSLATNDFVGGYCEQTGTQWAQTIVTNPPGFTIGTPRVIDLGTNQVPTGYTLMFRGYIVGQGKIGNEEVLINDDGADAQIVTIQVN